MNAPANPNKALWEKGDFTRIADTMRESGEALVQRLGITNGLKSTGSRMWRWHDGFAGGKASIPATFLRVTVAV